MGGGPRIRRGRPGSLGGRAPLQGGLRHRGGGRRGGQADRRARRLPGRQPAASGSLDGLARRRGQPQDAVGDRVGLALRLSGGLQDFPPWSKDAARLAPFPPARAVRTSPAASVLRPPVVVRNCGAWWQSPAVSGSGGLTLTPPRRVRRDQCGRPTWSGRSKKDGVAPLPSSLLPA